MVLILGGRSNRDIDKGQIVTLDQQTGAMNASVTLDNRVIGFNGGWNSIKRDHVTSGLFINEIAQSASDVAKTELGVTDFFEQIGKYATDRVTLEQQARDAEQQARLRGDEGADGSEEGLQELSDALTEAHDLSDGADIYLYDGSQIDDDTPVTGASDFNKALAAGGYHGSESDIYINIDHTDMTNSADTVRVLAHEQARHQMAQQGSTLGADDRSYLAGNRGDLASRAWAAYAGLEGFSTQGSYTSTDWNNQYRFTPKVIAGTNRLAPVPSQQVEPLVPVVVLAGVIAWEGAVIHDELKYGKSFPEAALDTENLLFGVGVGGTVASGGTIGPLATGLLVTGGTAGDVAYQNLVEQTPLSEIDYFNSLNSGLLTATVGGPATRLITSSGAVGSTARWTLLPGMTGYGAYESTGHVLQGYETGNWGQVVYGGAGLATLGAGLGVAKWGEGINLWPQGGGLVGFPGGTRQIIDVRRISGAEANLPFISPQAEAQGWWPPYPDSAGIRTFTTGDNLGGFVRVHTNSDPRGSFLVRQKEIEHLGNDPEKIRVFLGLKDQPVYISDVVVPSGTRMQAGRIGAQPNFGLTTSSGFQYQLLEEIPSASFGNTRSLK